MKTQEESKELFFDFQHRYSESCWKQWKKNVFIETK